MATQAQSQVLVLKQPADEIVRNPTQMSMRRFRSNRLAVGGLIVVAFFVFVALFAGVLAPFNYHYQDPTDHGQDARPGWVNLDTSNSAVTGKVSWLGTDDLGRDILTRLMYGSRISLLVGLIAESVVVMIGVPIGLAAGYFGGLVDSLLMRFTDIMYAFPDLLLLIILVTALGRSVFLIFIAVGLTAWVGMARLVRGQVMQVKQMDYVLGARSIGARPLGLMGRHVLPNILGPIIVVVTLGIPGAIIAEATLTFLGLGVEPSTPTWGTMVDAARGTIFSHPLEVLFPSLAIAALTLALTFVGDGMRDAFDPRMRAER